MAALADAAFYNDIYRGEKVYGDLDVLLERASDIVRQNTAYSLDDENLEKMPSFMLECVKKAVCAEVEYISANGGVDWLSGGGNSGFTIGKFSMSGGNSENNSGDKISGTALKYLEAAGLLYRGVDVKW